MGKSPALFLLLFAAVSLTLSARPDPELPERSIGIRVRADRTRVRMLDNGSIRKEFAGNVKIWNRSLSLKSMRAVWRSDSGVVRLYGGPSRGDARSSRSAPEERAHGAWFDSRGGTKLIVEARSAALFGRRGAADSLHASGEVVVRWIPRKAKAETQYIRWIARTREIYADSTVILTMSGMVERGTAFRARDDLARYTMRGVTGTMRKPGAGERKDK